MSGSASSHPSVAVRTYIVKKDYTIKDRQKYALLGDSKAYEMKTAGDRPAVFANSSLVLGSFSASYLLIYRE